MKKRQPIMMPGLLQDEINFAGLFAEHASKEIFKPPVSSKQKVKTMGKKGPTVYHKMIRK